MIFQSSFVQSRLSKANPGVLTAWCAFAAFVTYFSMYAFRKPFTAAKYDGIVFLGIGFKIILLFSQVSGYALSKFIGIKVISEMPAHRRALMILGLIALAHLALLPYAIAPYWLKPFFLFCNGLPLGMVFGCVLAFLEGRRVTEALAAGLCASFIMASGVVKSVGGGLMKEYAVSQFWMPFLTGAIFWGPLLIGVWMLQQIPPPDERDQTHRAPRPPINHDDRRHFSSQYALGLSLLIGMYVMLTIFRSVRDDYAPEIWSGFGVEKPDIFAVSETWVAVAVTLLASIGIVIRNNRRAFVIAMMLTCLSFAFALGTTLYYWGTPDWTRNSALTFMVLIGVGLYLPYVLFHTAIFERMIALLRDKSNIGYLMYLGDSAGYASTVVLMVSFNLIFQKNLNFVALLFWLAVIISPLCILASVAVVFYFRKREGAAETEVSPETEMVPDLRRGTT